MDSVINQQNHVPVANYGGPVGWFLHPYGGPCAAVAAAQQAFYIHNDSNSPLTSEPLLLSLTTAQAVYDLQTLSFLPAIDNGTASFQWNR